MAQTARSFLARAFGRSALVGMAATVADLASIALLVGLFGLDARAANLPSLLLGAAIQFVGNRRFAFEATAGSLRRQLALFTLVEVVALALNAVGYDLVARAIPLGAFGAVAARCAVSSAVFVLWSYPCWRRVFASESIAAAS